MSRPAVSVNGEAPPGPHLLALLVSSGLFEVRVHGPVMLGQAAWPVA